MIDSSRLHSGGRGHLGLEESLAGTLAELHGSLHDGVGVVAQSRGGQGAGDLGAGLGVEEDLAGDVGELSSLVPHVLDAGQDAGAAVVVDLLGELLGELGVGRVGGLVGNVLQVDDDFGEEVVGQVLAGLREGLLAERLGSERAERVQVVGLVVLRVPGVDGVARDTGVAGVGSGVVKEGGDGLDIVGVGLDGLLDLGLVWWGQLGAEGRSAASGEDSSRESGTSTTEGSRETLSVGNVAWGFVARIGSESLQWDRSTGLGDLTSDTGRSRTRLWSSWGSRVSISALRLVVAIATAATTVVTTKEPTPRRSHCASGGEDNCDGREMHC